MTKQTVTITEHDLKTMRHVLAGRGFENADTAPPKKVIAKIDELYGLGSFLRTTRF